MWTDPIRTGVRSWRGHADRLPCRARRSRRRPFELSAGGRNVVDVADGGPDLPRVDADLQGLFDRPVAEFGEHVVPGRTAARGPNSSFIRSRNWVRRTTSTVAAAAGAGRRYRVRYARSPRGRGPDGLLVAARPGSRAGGAVDVAGPAAALVVAAAQAVTPPEDIRTPWCHTPPAPSHTASGCRSCCGRCDGRRSCATMARQGVQRFRGRALRHGGGHTAVPRSATRRTAAARAVGTASSRPPAVCATMAPS